MRVRSLGALAWTIATTSWYLPGWLETMNPPALCPMIATRLLR
jgi:hypothetical protein